jgi:rfaE bifunctional protein kinase chain/domain
MNERDILAALPSLSALVVGDICLDRWCTYDPSTSEASRETGIPRIGVVRTETTPGAGGTVANNLKALGVGQVAVLGAIGEDGFGFELERGLAERGISAEWLVRSPEIQTFTYSKLINSESGVEDLPRVDFINTRPLAPAVERRILDNVQNAVDAFDVVLISDQAETSQGGVVTPAVRDLLKELAPAYPEKVFFVDSRARIELFRRAILKPNQQEAEAACHRLFGRVDYPALLRHTRARLLIVTHGGRGALVVSPQGETWVAARAIENPVDICGAGDSFSAGTAMALAVTRSPELSVRFGHLVASITIMKKGTGTASPEEVLAAAGERNP